MMRATRIVPCEANMKTALEVGIADNQAFDRVVDPAMIVKPYVAPI